MQRRREEREAEKIRSEEELQFIQRERAVAEGRELDKKEELVSFPFNSFPHPSPTHAVKPEQMTPPPLCCPAHAIISVLANAWTTLSASLGYSITCIVS